MCRLQLRLLSRSTTHKSKSKAPSGYRAEFFLCSSEFKKIFKKTVTFSVFADYIYRTFNKSKICIFARFIYTFAFAVFRSGVLRYNFCTRQTTAPVQPHCILNLTTSTLNSYKSAAAGGHPLPLCALSGYENNNLRAGKERQPLCGQFNL